MKKRLLLIFSLLLLISFQSSPVFANKADDTDMVLSSAESLFKAMKARNYVLIWKHLSLKSRATIVDDTLNNLLKSGISSYTKEQLFSDFVSGDALSKAYWNAFLANFDPDSVLQKSSWKMGQIKKDRADVIIKHNKSENPAVLQMFREEGSWKVGLVETFWQRR